MNLKLSEFPFAVVIFSLMALNAFAAVTDPNPESTTVSGKALYLQRKAMPPEAVLSVRVEDVTLADAKSQNLGEFKEAFGDRQVPIPFSIQVRNAAIVAKHSYNLRATISVNGEMQFTTTRNYPVLTQDAKNEVELVLDPVRPVANASPAQSPPTAPTSNFATPATYSGILPCADCLGIEHTLTLQSGGLYLFRRTYQDKPAGNHTETGRWQAENGLLILYNGVELQLFDIVDATSLRQLDRNAQTIQTSANLDLRRAERVVPISEPLDWHGEFVYMADAASFTDCVTGIRWPVATIEDYLATERNYQKNRKAPGKPLIVNFQGRLEVRPAMEGAPVEQMVITKFGKAQPGKACAALTASKAKNKGGLKDTYWKLLEIDGKKTPGVTSYKQQIHIIFASEGSRVFGYGGCNRLMGSYAAKGKALHLTKMASSMMACISDTVDFEPQVHKMLNDTTGYRIDGKKLSLLKGKQVLGLFEAPYLP